MQSPRSMSPRSSLLSASPRRQYRVAPHGRAAWQTNYPPFANPELAMKTAMERNVQARPWLHGSMVAGSNTPIAPISPRQMGKLAPVSIDRVPVPVPAPRRAKEMPFVPAAPLADRWEEALTARRPGQRKEKTVQRIFERIDKGFQILFGGVCSRRKTRSIFTVSPRPAPRRARRRSIHSDETAGAARCCVCTPALAGRAPRAGSRHAVSCPNLNCAGPRCRWRAQHTHAWQISFIAAVQ